MQRARSRRLGDLRKRTVGRVHIATNDQKEASRAMLHSAVVGRGHVEGDAHVMMAFAFGVHVLKEVLVAIVENSYRCLNDAKFVIVDCNHVHCVRKQTRIRGVAIPEVIKPRDVIARGTAERHVTLGSFVTEGRPHCHGLVREAVCPYSRIIELEHLSRLAVRIEVRVGHEIRRQ